MSFAPKAFVVGALGLAAGAVAVPAQATDFYNDGYDREVVIVKKRVVQPIHDFDDDDDFPRRRIVVKKHFTPVHGFYDSYPQRTVIVKKRFVHPTHGFYNEPRTVVVKKRVVHPGYGFHGPRHVGFHGYQGFHGGF